jgi:hypothetical protein
VNVYSERGDEGQISRTPKTSFFTRRLANKLGQKGVDVPSSVMTFLDTPLCTLNEQESLYFESKFCPLIPNIVSALEEIFNEIGADPEGWEDMMTYAGNLDTLPQYKGGTEDEEDRPALLDRATGLEKTAHIPLRLYRRSSLCAGKPLPASGPHRSRLC